jgi:hypothetical protein
MLSMGLITQFFGRVVYRSGELAAVLERLLMLHSIKARVAAALCPKGCAGPIRRIPLAWVA